MDMQLTVAQDAPTSNDSPEVPLLGNCQKESILTPHVQVHANRVGHVCVALTGMHGIPVSWCKGHTDNTGKQFSLFLRLCQPCHRLVGFCQHPT